ECSPCVDIAGYSRAPLLRRRFHSLRLRYGPVGRAHLEAGKAADGNVFAQLAHLLPNQLLDADGLVLDKGLLQQADLLVKLGHLAFNDLFDYGRRLARGSRLRAKDILLALEVVRGN